jgi:hypothetical protein
MAATEIEPMCGGTSGASMVCARGVSMSQGHPDGYLSASPRTGHGPRTKATRPRLRACRNSHGWGSLRYPSDLTDSEWKAAAGLLPAARRGGRPRQADLREIVNGILYVLETGCLWTELPESFPPKSTVYDYFARWRSDRTLLKLYRTLYASTSA